MHIIAELRTIMTNYYSNSLNSSRLQKCYAVAPDRVKQFLEAEIDFVLDKTNSNDTVLDLGCGYGRVSTRLLAKAKSIVGIDISKDNIQLAREIAGDAGNIAFYEMNAIDLKFDDHVFDLVICIQNGISSFMVDPKNLIQEAIRVTRPQGVILFSSYSEKFWEDRLKWFHIQAEHGLIGEIDETLTKNGIIVCKDGFRAITYSGQEFLELASGFNVHAQIHEVDNSIVFCEMVVK
ncbi:MAG: class I SAM-dependent methyltransferase [Bacteroidetes bacterium]|nr:MAG: class I SAM-dependent methyltransferase [Bacteroidota bacterium]